MPTDKTGAPTTVTAGTDRFTIAVSGQEVGLVAIVDPLTADIKRFLQTVQDG
jgi:hypothetical protein